MAGRNSQKSGFQKLPASWQKLPARTENEVACMENFEVACMQVCVLLVQKKFARCLHVACSLFARCLLVACMLLTCLPIARSITYLTARLVVYEFLVCESPTSLLNIFGFQYLDNPRQLNLYSTTINFTPNNYNRCLYFFHIFCIRAGKAFLGTNTFNQIKTAQKRFLCVRTNCLCLQ